ncbi:MAG TPA: CHAP domain-containing protein [Chitinispirillaceae bacterium]|nr:CHAP domain-containing protein [Chitinispirillaceae bacterium]
MVKTLLFVTALFIYGFTQTVNVTGTIVNQADTPVEGIIVLLKHNQISDTTDENGAFHLLKNATTVLKNRRLFSEYLTITGDRLSILPDVRGRDITFELFSLNGVKLFSSNDLKPGQDISVSRYLKTSKMHIGLIRIAGQTYKFTMIKMGNKVVSRDMTDNSSQCFCRTGQIKGDTLSFVRRGDVEFEMFKTELVDDINVKLDLVPWEVIDLAVKEEGRYPDEVGKDLKTYPYAISNYLQKIGSGVHDYEAWCSEFVSWAYKATGYELSGGYGERWMLGGSIQLRNWFQKNAEFVDRENRGWESFVPAPGDYVRYDNDFGGHSGIVRYVSNDTLYTVEGNCNNKVYIRRIPRWKTYQDRDNTRIDGIGRRSGTTAVVF